jgi:hypothetical protein
MAYVIDGSAGTENLPSVMDSRRRPTSADVGDSSIFHGSADVGWDWRMSSEIEYMNIRTVKCLT